MASLHPLPPTRLPKTYVSDGRHSITRSVAINIAIIIIINVGSGDQVTSADLVWWGKWGGQSLSLRYYGITPLWHYATPTMPMQMHNRNRSFSFFLSSSKSQQQLEHSRTPSPPPRVYDSFCFLRSCPFVLWLIQIVSDFLYSLYSAINPQLMNFIDRQTARAVSCELPDWH